MPGKDGDHTLHPSTWGNEVKVWRGGRADFKVKASLGYTARLWVLSVVGR